MPELVKKDDGTTIVVDRFSGKRYPPDEEAWIIATCSDRVEETKTKEGKE